MIMIAQALEIPLDKDFLLKLAVYEKEALKILNKKEKDAEKDAACNSHKRDECKIIYGEHFDWACANCEEMKNGRAGSKAKNND